MHLFDYLYKEKSRKSLFSRNVYTTLSIAIRNGREYPFGGVIKLKGQTYTDAHDVEDAASPQYICLTIYINKNSKGRCV